MAESSLLLALSSSLLACAAYSFAFLFWLGLRIMRSSLADRNSAAPYFAFLVGTAILTATLALEASSLIGMSRDMAGRLFYAAGISGAIATAASVGGAVGPAVKLPVRIAWMRRRIALRGLVIGNACVVLANVLAATQVLPSLL